MWPGSLLGLGAESDGTCQTFLSASLLPFPCVSCNSDSACPEPWRADEIRKHDMLRGVCDKQQVLDECLWLEPLLQSCPCVGLCSAGNQQGAQPSRTWVWGPEESGRATQHTCHGDLPTRDREEGGTFSGSSTAHRATRGPEYRQRTAGKQARHAFQCFLCHLSPGSCPTPHQAEWGWGVAAAS